MITPRFEVTQDSDSLIITVFTPFGRISEVEINIIDSTFIFYCSPYYLRLTFKGKLIDSEEEKHKSEFNGDNKSFKITCLKVNPGQQFPELDMLTKLLTPQGSTQLNKPNIEVLDEENQESDDDENEWLFEQQLAPGEAEEAAAAALLPSDAKYGFGGNSSAIFKRLSEELHQLFEVKDPDNKSLIQKREERLSYEKEKFDEDYYLADLFDDDNSKIVMNYIPPYFTITKEEVSLDESEKEAMLKLPRRKYLLDKGKQTACVYSGLIDLLFTWCYNHRINEGEGCAEAAWNLTKLSPTLSWLESFTSIKEVIVASIRRSLIFPLIRNWDLSQQVLKDVEKVLVLGQKQVLKCLLSMHKTFINFDDPYYLLNELYLTDYCVWIQTVNDAKLLHLSDKIKNLSVKKSDLDLELDELETAARAVLNEQIDNSPEVDSIADGIHNLSVIENTLATNFNENDFHLPVNCNRERLQAVSDSDDSSSSSGIDSDSDSDDDSSSSSSDSTVD